MNPTFLGAYYGYDEKLKFDNPGKPANWVKSKLGTDDVEEKLKVDLKLVEMVVEPLELQEPIEPLMPPPPQPPEKTFFDEEDLRAVLEDVEMYGEVGEGDQREGDFVDIPSEWLCGGAINVRSIIDEKCGSDANDGRALPFEVAMEFLTVHKDYITDNNLWSTSAWTCDIIGPTVIVAQYGPNGNGWYDFTKDDKGGWTLSNAMMKVDGTSCKAARMFTFETMDGTVEVGGLRTYLVPRCKTDMKGCVYIIPAQKEMLLVYYSKSGSFDIELKSHGNSKDALNISYGRPSFGITEAIKEHVKSKKPSVVMNLLLPLHDTMEANVVMADLPSKKQVQYARSKHLESVAAAPGIALGVPKGVNDVKSVLEFLEKKDVEDRFVWNVGGVGACGVTCVIGCEDSFFWWCTSQICEGRSPTGADEKYANRDIEHLYLTFPCPIYAGNPTFLAAVGYAVGKGSQNWGSCITSVLGAVETCSKELEVPMDVSKLENWLADGAAAIRIGVQSGMATVGVDVNFFQELNHHQRRTRSKCDEILRSSKMTFFQKFNVESDIIDVGSSTSVFRFDSKFAISSLGNASKYGSEFVKYAARAIVPKVGEFVRYALLLQGLDSDDLEGNWIERKHWESDSAAGNGSASDSRKRVLLVENQTCSLINEMKAEKKQRCDGLIGFGTVRLGVMFRDLEIGVSIWKGTDVLLRPFLLGNTKLKILKRCKKAFCLVVKKFFGRATVLKAEYVREYIAKAGWIIPQIDDLLGEGIKIIQEGSVEKKSSIHYQVILPGSTFTKDVLLKYSSTGALIHVACTDTSINPLSKPVVAVAIKFGIPEVFSFQFSSKSDYAFYGSKNHSGRKDNMESKRQDQLSMNKRNPKTRVGVPKAGMEKPLILTCGSLRAILPPLISTLPMKHGRETDLLDQERAQKRIKKSAATFLFICAICFRKHKKLEQLVICSNCHEYCCKRKYVNKMKCSKKIGSDFFCKKHIS